VPPVCGPRHALVVDRSSRNSSEIASTCCIVFRQAKRPRIVYRNDKVRRARNCQVVTHRLGLLGNNGVAALGHGSIVVGSQEFPAWVLDANLEGCKRVQCVALNCDGVDNIVSNPTHVRTKVYFIKNFIALSLESTLPELIEIFLSYDLMAPHLIQLYGDR